jgi:hypothetical protein
MDVVYTDAGMKFRNRKTFRYDIPAYAGPFRSLSVILITICGGKIKQK